MSRRVRNDTAVMLSHLPAPRQPGKRSGTETSKMNAAVKMGVQNSLFYFPLCDFSVQSTILAVKLTQPGGDSFHSSPMKRDPHYRFLIFRCLFAAVMSAHAVAEQTGGSAPKLDLAPFTNVRDYGCMYWMDGLNNPNFRIQTSRFALNYNHRSFGPTALACLTQSPDEASSLVAAAPRLPQVTFACGVTIDGNAHPAAAASNNPRDSQIVESGRCFQRRWQPGTVAGIATDPTRTGLETTAWPDRISLIFRFSPTAPVKEGSLEMTLSFSEVLPMVASEGQSVGIANRQGKGFVFLPASGATSIEVDQSNRTIRVRSAAGGWQPGRSVSVGMIIYPAASGMIHMMKQAVAAENSPPVVDASALEPAMPRLAVIYEKDQGWFRVSVPKGTPGDDGRMRARIVVKNPGPESRVIRFNFDGAPFYIPGITAVLRDRDGFPLGIPVQYSKNWHGKAAPPDNPAGFSGEWFHGLTMITVPAQGEYEFELMMTGENWGGMAAASHAQLSTIGYGGNQQWDQAALGNRGEALCYDMDHVLTDNDFTDSRPFCLLNPEGRRNWGVNAGGGSVLRYSDASGKARRHSRMRVRYSSYGPNLAEARFAGLTDDGAMDLTYSAAIFRADDCTRGFHQIRISVNRDTSFSRIAFYQQSGDSYCYNQGDSLSYGNADKSAPIRTWKASGKPNNYTGAPVALEGSAPWVAVTNAPAEAGYRPANHGFVIRFWEARLGGRPANIPYFRERRNGSNVSLLELVPPPGVTSLKTGDFVHADIVRVYVPRSADAYAGRNENFRRALREYDNDPRMILREAAGNKLTTRVTVGLLEAAYPLRIRAANNRAAFAITGGIGAIPVTFSGLGDYRRPVLEQQSADGWRKIDQSSAGNDFWQCAFQPETRTWEITYTLRPDDAYQNVESLILSPVTRNFRFRLAEPDAASLHAP